MQVHTSALRPLKIHPLLAQVPETDETDPAFKRMLESVLRVGVLEPLKVTPEGEIVDGRLRFRAAKVALLNWVPCIEVSPLEAATVIVNSLVARRHYNVSQLAYLMAPVIEPAFEEARRRKLANLPGSRFSPTAQETVGSWAAKLGISVRCLQEARQLHELFLDDTPRTLTDRDGVTEENVTFKSFFEPRLLKDYRDQKPYGLGAIIAGISYVLAHDGRPLPRIDDWRFRLLSNSLLKDLPNRAKYWDQLGPEQIADLKTGIQEAFQRMPESMLNLLENGVRFARKRVAERPADPIRPRGRRLSGASIVYRTASKLPERGQANAGQEPDGSDAPEE